MIIVWGIYEKNNSYTLQCISIFMRKTKIGIANLVFIGEKLFVYRECGDILTLTVVAWTYWATKYKSSRLII